MAGARVDRIAAAAGANKAMLYTYLGNKEQFFDAVFGAMVAAASDGSPSTRTTCPASSRHVRPLPYRQADDAAIGLVPSRARQPGPHDAVWVMQRDWLAAVAKGQHDKVIRGRLNPPELLGVVTALTRMGATEFAYLNPPSSTAARGRRARHHLATGPALTGSPQPQVKFNLDENLPFSSLAMALPQQVW